MTRMGPASAQAGGSSLAQQLQGMRPAEDGTNGGGATAASSAPSAASSAPGRPPRPGSATGRDPVGPRLAPIDPNAVGQMAPGPGSYGGFGGGGGGSSGGGGSIGGVETVGPRSDRSDAGDVPTLAVNPKSVIGAVNDASEQLRAMDEVVSAFDDKGLVAADRNKEMSDDFWTMNHMKLLYLISKYSHCAQTVHEKERWIRKLPMLK
jgi:hypothetical protein